MKMIRRTLYPLLILLILAAVWQLVSIRQDSVRSQALYDELAAQTVEGTDPLAELRALNTDTVGWITIPGTTIDYPVLQSTEEPDYYLTHDFNKEESSHGAIYMDAACSTVDSENLIMYGHHMRDGSMFQNLTLYEDPAFLEQHPDIDLTTDAGAERYTIYMVMILSQSDCEDFPYFRCTDFTDQDMINGFLTRCSQFALVSNTDINTNAFASGGPTRLLTLSTCEYSKENGRLVIVAGRP